MKFLYKYAEVEDYTQIVNEGFIEFGILRLTKGRNFVNIEDDKETALIVLSGKCTIKCDVYKWKSIGERNSVFEGNAYAAYIPFNYKYEISTEELVEIAICKAPSNHKSEPLLITPTDVKCKIVGKSNWKRKVCDIIDLDVNAKRLLVGETFNSPGNWSSYPPHHHPQPEIYHYRFTEPQGFGHAELGDTVLKVRQFDSVKIFDGNDHAQCAAPGYGMYYSWVIRHLPGNPYTVPEFTEEHRWTMEEGARFWRPAGIDDDG